MIFAGRLTGPAVASSVSRASCPGRGRSVSRVRLFSTGAFAISTQFRHNHQIRISPIFLIDQNDVKVGIISTGEALKRVSEPGLRPILQACRKLHAVGGTPIQRRG